MKDFIEDINIADSCKMKFTYASKESHKDVTAEKVAYWEFKIGEIFCKLLENHEDARKQIKKYLPKFEMVNSKQINLVIELFNGEISKKIIRKAMLENSNKV